MVIRGHNEHGRGLQTGKTRPDVGGFLEGGIRGDGADLRHAGGNPFDEGGGQVGFDDAPLLSLAVGIHQDVLGIALLRQLDGFPVAGAVTASFQHQNGVSALGCIHHQERGRVPEGQKQQGEEHADSSQPG